MSSLLTQRQLYDFETAAISNLKPVDFDEAKTLVPSLESGERFDEQQIQQMLDDMANVRKFE